MYRREIFSVLLIPIVGVINVALGSVFNVFSIPLEVVDSVSYCRKLDVRLRETQSSVLLLEVGRPSQAYEVVRAGEGRKVCNMSVPEDHQNASSVTDILTQMIHNSEVSVEKHQIVDHITLRTPEGEFVLTVERTGELETNHIESRFGGSSNRDKLLLSLIGGGRIRSFERTKNP